MPAIANRMAARAKRQNDPDVSFARGGRIRATIRRRESIHRLRAACAQNADFAKRGNMFCREMPPQADFFGKLKILTHYGLRCTLFLSEKMVIFKLNALSKSRRQIRL